MPAPEQLWGQIATGPDLTASGGQRPCFAFPFAVAGFLGHHAEADERSSGMLQRSIASKASSRHIKVCYSSELEGQAIFLSDSLQTTIGLDRMSLHTNP